LTTSLKKEDTKVVLLELFTTLGLDSQHFISSLVIINRLNKLLSLSLATLSSLVYCNTQPLGLICQLRRKWSVVNMVYGAIIATLYFILN